MGIFNKKLKGELTVGGKLYKAIVYFDRNRKGDKTLVVQVPQIVFDKPELTGSITLEVLKPEQLEIPDFAILNGMTLQMGITVEEGITIMKTYNYLLQEGRINQIIPEILTMARTELEKTLSPTVVMILISELSDDFLHYCRHEVSLKHWRDRYVKEELH